MIELAHFKRKHPPEVCALAFALVADVLQDRSLSGTADEIKARLDQAALEFASAASDAGRKPKQPEPEGIYVTKGELARGATSGLIPRLWALVQAFERDGFIITVKQGEAK